jgi:hypothetical protein
MSTVRTKDPLTSAHFGGLTDLVLYTVHPSCSRNANVTLYHYAYVTHSRSVHCQPTELNSTALSSRLIGFSYLFVRGAVSNTDDSSRFKQ